jgi:hypothetical protein
MTLFLVLLVLAQAGFAAEKPSKYTALKALKTAAEIVPQNVRNQLIKIEGQEGRLHPQVWQVTFFDTSASMDQRVVTVSRGEILTDEEPFALLDNVNLSSCIDLHDVKLDSKQVIDGIHRLCYENRLPLYIMDITLEKSQKGKVTPLWVCVLKNARGNEFGIVKVSAKSGKILETEDVTLTADSKLRAEKSFGQKTADTFLGIGADMEQFFTGKRTVDN